MMGSRLPRAAAILAVALLTGCSGQSHGHAAPPAETVPSKVAVNPVDGSLMDVQLPVDAYRFTPTQRSEIQQAENILLSQCMQRYGYTFAATTTLHQQPPENAFRYGPVTSEQAQDGYSWQLMQGSDTSQMSSTAKAMQAMSAAETAVFRGTATPSASGGAAPHGGCVGEMQHTITAGGAVLDDSDLVQQIDQASYAGSQNSPQLTAAFAAWSACMAKSGYVYKTPMDPLKDRTLMSGDPSSNAATSKQVTVAGADVACKKQTNLVAVWTSVESAMQRSAIESHAEELTNVKKQIDQTMRNIATVIGKS